MLVSGIEHGTSFLNLLQRPLAHQLSYLAGQKTSFAMVLGTTLDNIIA